MVDKRDLRALRPQTLGQRFQAIRLTLGGGLLIIVGTLLLLAELATGDSPAFGIAGILIGIGVIAFTVYRRIARLRRVSALHTAAASVGGYQLNTTYSQTAAAQEAAAAVAAAPVQRRRTGLTVVLVIVALVVVLIPVWHALTKAPDKGTVVPIGTSQSVDVTGDDYKKTDAAGVAELRVTGIRRASASDLGDVELTPEQKKQTVFFVDYTAKRTSGSFDPDAPGVLSEYNWRATESDGTTASAVIAIIPPAACSSGDGRQFVAGKTVTGCVLFLSATTKPPTSVTFEESAGAYTWSTAGD